MPSNCFLLKKNTEHIGSAVDIIIRGKMYIAILLILIVFLYRIPIPIIMAIKMNDGFWDPLCPRCGNAIDREFIHFCSSCGQRLNWTLWNEYVIERLPPYRTPCKSYLICILASLLFITIPVYEILCTFKQQTYKVVFCLLKRSN